MNSPTNWYDTNTHYLLTAVANVHHALKHYVENQQNSASLATPNDASALAEIAATMPAPPALEQLCAIFDLSAFERHILLLGVGMAIFHDFPALCANVHGNPQKPYPTFNLAVQVFHETHWNAFLPYAPLRYWHLLQMDSNEELSHSRLRVDEGILHYLMGEPYHDPSLLNWIQPIPSTASQKKTLPKSHQQLVEQLVATLFKVEELSAFPLVQLCGSEIGDKRAIASAACANVERSLKILKAHHLPSNIEECQHLMRRWEREFVLTHRLLLLDCEQINMAEPAKETLILQFIEDINTPMIISSEERLHSPQRAIISFDVPKLTHHEQHTLWQTTLGNSTPEVNQLIENMVSQFHLSTSAIQAASLALQTQQPIDNTGEISTPAQALWTICRNQARPRLDDLAQRIESTTTWADLVLPETQRQMLQDLAAHVRHRVQVYQKWGFAGKNNRGLGISALFSGSSGTGKTLTAEVLAKTLQLDLYRIDLSAVVSKYIGETEKNLRRIFDAAETGGAILLFDEADALFGKRTETKDSHDRYANVEVSYLLQRMESYQGLAVMTTNLKENIDTAFLRRIRFIVSFPFPDAKARADIWQCIFPKATPTAGLDFNKLAQLKVSGGNISNIALNAAFKAADAGEAVMMKHILSASKTEYIKLERTLYQEEIEGWIETDN